MNSIIHLSVKQLRRAASIKHKIETLEKRLSRLLDGTAGAATPRRRRRMSASARAKIGAAVKARWAKRRRTKVLKATPKPRRKVSLAARKRLAQLAKARWAKAKAAGEKSL